jgi:alginate O-acetyltransferase complex protein AlgI
MLFNSYTFLFGFLPLTLFAIYLCRYVRALNVAIILLIVASFLFYAWWDWRFVFLLFASALVNWFCGRAAADKNRPKVSCLALCLGIMLNLGVLAFFKYRLFFADLVSLKFAGTSSAYIWILPLGISFWTFEQIIYLADCYSTDQKPLSFRNYLLFITFFPRLVAGPIVRPRDFFEAFSKWHSPIPISFIAAGLTLVAIGLFKKVVLADPLGSFVDPTFKYAEGGYMIGFRDAWAAAIGFSFKIYFDFSGYSDIAIGLALLFGISLPANFNSPYHSLSIIEFWRRWHISLSRFLRDYLYVPLGGNRKGSARQLSNILITMLLGGLWHGAGANFLLWGMLHGTYLMTAHGFRKAVRARGQVRIPSAISAVVTFFAVVIGWVFFRADSLLGAKTMLIGMAGNPHSGDAFPVPAVFGGIYQLALLSYCAAHCFLLPSTTVLFREFMFARDGSGGTEPKTPSKAPVWRPSMAWAVLASACFSAAVWGLLETNQQFIYFQF